MEQQKSKFRHLVGDSRTMKTVVDVRNMMKYMNIEVKRPADWKDPYKVKEHFEATAAKQIKHAEARLKILMSKEEGLQKAIAATKRTLECASKTAEEPEKRARMSEEMETDQSTNRTVKWIKPEEPSPRNVRYRDEKEEAEVREQQFLAPPPAAPAKPTKSYAEVVKAQPRAPTPTPAATGPFTITPAIASTILKAVNSGTGEIINKTGTVRIDGSDIKTAVGKKWLNDSVISAYMQLITDRSKIGSYPKVYAFNTFFFPILDKENFLPSWSSNSMSGTADPSASMPTKVQRFTSPQRDGACRVRRSRPLVAREHDNDQELFSYCRQFASQK